MNQPVQIEVPGSLLEEIEADVAAFRQDQLNRLIPLFAEREHLRWTPEMPHPPSHEDRPTTGAGKYHGDVAAGYDAKREQSQKWQFEQQAIELMLSDLAPGSWVLDCPCGTGRFIPFYERQRLWVHAVDISEDMLRQAARKRQRRDNSIQFMQADILDLGLWPKSVDAAVMCRLTRWLTPEQCQQAVIALQRIARRKIIFTTRIEHPHRPDLARPLALYQAALDGWKISQVARLPDDEAYLVVMLEPIA